MVTNENDDSTRRTRFIVSLVVGLCVAVAIDNYFYLKSIKKFNKVEKWLSENGFPHYSPLFEKYGITSMEKFAELSESDILKLIGYEEHPDIYQLLEKRIQMLQREQFQSWIKMSRLEHLQKEFAIEDIYTLENVLTKIDLFKGNQFLDVFPTIIDLEMNKNNLKKYPVFYEESVWRSLFSWLFTIVKFIALLVLLIIFLGFVSVWFIVSLFVRNRNENPLAGIIPAIVVYLESLLTSGRRRRPQSNMERNPLVSSTATSSLGSLLRLGFNFSPSKSRVMWDGMEFVVGEEKTIIVQLVRSNGMSYEVSNLESIKCEISHQKTMIENRIENDKERPDQIKIYFTPISAGEYEISILANGQFVSGSTHARYFMTGKIDPLKSSLVVPSCLLVLQEGKQEMLTLDERDKFGNPYFSSVEELLNYQFVICEYTEERRRISPQLSFAIENPFSEDKRNRAWLTITDAGVYTVDVFYKGEAISEDVILLVLSESEMVEVEKNVNTPSWSLYYEGHYYNDYVTEHLKRTVSVDGEGLLNYEKTMARLKPAENAKKKKVYCYITCKFLTLKEYYLKILFKGQRAFRIKPSVKILLHGECSNEPISNSPLPYKCFTIQSSRESVTLYCQQRNILVATFIKTMLKNIGGSEAFEDKRLYFYRELYNIGSSNALNRTEIKVHREMVVKDTMKAVKGFSKTDWWRKFYIIFHGEEGMDYGGVSREWMQLILGKLFHTNGGGLFRRFNKDDQQALIHPNPIRTGNFQKVKYFEFAGCMVGKCLVECSIEKSRRQFVKARFTRSFLAQLLGLGVSWKHFETDDKVYYSGKIKYILENDPSYLDIYFVEDLYDHEDRLVKTVDLKPNGSTIQVTEENKLEYLQLLAQFRLCDSVKNEINSFLKGLNSIVDDGLLSIFDENELELVLCGMENISVSDMKKNCIVEDSFFSPDMITWFWSVVSGFSQEELSRLLQFTTGCSMLPPEGFSGLSPSFKIQVLIGSSSNLPTSHTCFNTLVLPSYSGAKELKEKLLLSINEGSEGFGLT